MTHLYTIRTETVDNIIKYWAHCTCGWDSLKYNNGHSADLAGGFHVANPGK